MSDFALSYADMTTVLGGLHGIPTSGEGAFKARLRKLQAEGVPDGSNPGKGKRVSYTIRMLVELAIALELSQAGYSAPAIAKIFKTERERLYLAALSAKGSTGAQGDLVVFLTPETFSDDSCIARLPIVSRAGLMQSFSSRVLIDPETGAAPKPDTPQARRWLIIELRMLMLALNLCLEEALSLDYDAARQPFTDEAQSYALQISELAEQIQYHEGSLLGRVGDGRP